MGFLLRNSAAGPQIAWPRVAALALAGVAFGGMGVAVASLTSGRALLWSFVASAVPVWLAVACLAEWQLQAARSREGNRRGVRFRLGWALIAVAFVALWCSALAGQRRAFLAAQRAEQELTSALREVVRRGVVRVDGDGCVIQVLRSDFSDADLGLVVDRLRLGNDVQPELTVLDLSGTQVSDAGLRLLDDGPRVQHLVVDRSRVTPRGLQTLPWIGKLRSLSFHALGLTPEDVREIQQIAPDTILGSP